MKTLISLALLFSLSSMAQSENLTEIENSIEGQIQQEPDRNLIKNYTKSKKEFKKLMKEDPKALANADRIKKLQLALVADPKLQARLSEIMTQCQADTENCNKNLEAFLVEVVGPNDEAVNPASVMGASKGTFGICAVDDKTKGIHAGVYGKRFYNCKLSTSGLVYDRQVERKNYGPGIYRAKHSILLACSGNAFNTTSVGYSTGVGLYYGLSLGTTFGKGGICLYVGIGKSIGAYTGVEVLKFK